MYQLEDILFVVMQVLRDRGIVKRYRYTADADEARTEAQLVGERRVKGTVRVRVERSEADAMVAVWWKPTLIDKWWMDLGIVAGVFAEDPMPLSLVNVQPILADVRRFALGSISAQRITVHYGLTRMRQGLDATWMQGAQWK